MSLAFALKCTIVFLVAVALNLKDEDKTKEAEEF
jgi:hypothetical protein